MLIFKINIKCEMASKKITLEEYANKLFYICGEDENEIKKKLKNIEPQVKMMYEQYINDIKTEFKYRNGRAINLNHVLYYYAQRKVSGNSSEFWFVTSDLKQYLLKESTKYFVMSKGKPYISENNYILVPQLAKQFDIESALYYLIEFYDNEGELDTYIVTPDFKGKDSNEIITGTTIISKMLEEGGGQTLDVKEMLRRIERYLSIRHVSQKEIEEVKREFIKQTFFYKFIDNKDQNNTNWGIIVEDKHVKLTPVYDFDFCFGNERLENRERYVGEKKTDILSFLEQFKDLKWFQEWTRATIENIDTKKLFNDVYEETNIKIPTSAQKYYVDRIQSKINEVKIAIETAFGEKCMEERN